MCERERAGGNRHTGTHIGYGGVNRIWEMRGRHNGERAMGRACNGLIGREVHGGDSEPEISDRQRNGKNLRNRGQTQKISR